jgi:hypothetical protein
MITLIPSTPPSPPDQTTAFFNLLNLVADPDAAKKRLAEIHDATLKANEQIAEARTAQGEFAAARAEHDARISKELKEHDAKLKSERAACASECAMAMAEVRLQQERASKLDAKAKADATAAADLKSDLETRLAKIRSAAA